MHQVALPAVVDAVLFALAAVLGASEALLFRTTRDRRHLWAALLCGGGAAFAALIFAHYHAEPRHVPWLTRIEGAVIVLEIHAWLMLAPAVLGRRPPIRPRLVLASAAVTVGLLLWGDSLTGTTTRPMRWLDHPFPRQEKTAVASVTVAYGVAVSTYMLAWFVRHGWGRERTVPFIAVGLLFWMVCGLLDVLATSLGWTAPMHFFDVGVVGFVVALATVDVRAYLALMRSTRLDFHRLVERAPDLVAVLRGERILYANAALRRALGRDSVAGELAEDALGFALAEVTQFGAPTEAWLGSGDARVHVELIALEETFEGGPATVLVGRDLHERDQLTARSIELDRMATMGRVAAGVGHEINNPLAYAILALEDARDLMGGGAPDADVRERIETGLDGARRIQRIVQGLRGVSRGHGELRPTDVAEVLRSAVAIAESELRHAARLELDLEDVPPVRADPTRLSQVFVNLLVNAAHAVPRDGPDAQRVRVSVRESKGLVVFEVLDTGPGVPEARREDIFALFFTTKPPGVGTGLGLSMSRESMRSMGGQLAYVQREGWGAGIRGELPIASAAVAPEPEAPVEIPTPPRRPRVLLVDDEPQLLRALKRSLRKDADVVCAESGDEAIAELERDGAYDLVITDLQMPSGSGADLYAWAEANAPTIAARMQFATGGAFTPDARALVERFPDRVIYKPFETLDLRRRIAESVL